MLCPKLCAAIAAGTVEQNNDGLSGFKIPEGAGAFPDPTGVRIGLKDAGVDVLNKRTLRCLLIAVGFTRRQQHRRLCRRNIPGLQKQQLKRCYKDAEDNQQEDGPEPCDKQQQSEKKEKDQGFIRHTPLVLFLIHSLHVLSVSAQAAQRYGADAIPWDQPCCG